MWFKSQPKNSIVKITIMILLLQMGNRLKKFLGFTASKVMQMFAIKSLGTDMPLILPHRLLGK